MPQWVLFVLGFNAEGKSGRHITPTLENYQTFCLRNPEKFLCATQYGRTKEFNPF